ncbi:leader peptidase (prepilin peptidase) / N-methyltransferase [Nocardioides terrae]|uniref:Leader peptidase (Prepilin peptidase) / N-methyltransferase n=1 Tax=Nocardioides terrae TaxID=574651 RepID=A0A1I1M6D6_9ACTN|nr:prepilin peptidase [Nocardioides terrae]SFC78143.1 leader peptidase (prepilin peptidase) / N-methyltransferase [Nocardioides terrae]
MHLVPALVCAVLGAGSGWLVPRLIAGLPEPEADPEEKPGEFPDKVLYVDLAAAPGLAWRCALACALAAGLLGAVFGWVWALPWLAVLVPIGCALAVIDYVTWYLPSRILAPAYAVVGLLVVVAAVAVHDWHVVLHAAIGWAALGAYYGLMWFISPRIMAFGDVRLGGLIGLALGPLGYGQLILSVLAAGVFGALSFIPLKLLGRTIKREPDRGPLREHVPFGPFLLLGALAAAVAGSLLGLA